MSKRPEISECAVDDADRLARRIAATRLPPSRLRGLEDGITRARSAGVSAGPDADDTLTLLRSQFTEARLIHKYIHQTPFRDAPRKSRSRQWEDTLSFYRHLGNVDLIDWIRLQIEVARNLEQGIQDMRPRKNGPTWLVVLEYVANAKRKALAVLHWAMDSEATGRLTVDSDFHARTESILERRSRAYDARDGGHEAVPWAPGDE